MRTRQSKKQPSTMKKCDPQTKARNFEYPDQTEGSQLAANVRKEANGLTENQRSEFFKRGMQIIDGGPETKEKVRSGH
jgi:hypothetical protein